MIAQYTPGGLPFVEVTLTHETQSITRSALTLAAPWGSLERAL